MAGQVAGSLTAAGAALLDPSGALRPGIPFCPPEGDAGTGMVATEGTHGTGIVGGDFEKQYVAGAPLGRIGQPRDISGVASFLASADADWITGEAFFVAGGYR